MAENLPVRCPACRREHVYTPTAYPCPCGAPVTLPLLSGGAPVQVRTRTWADSWVEGRCSACGRQDQWPQPEFGCPCGAMVRLPVAPIPRAGAERRSPAGPSTGPARAVPAPATPVSRPPVRPAFRPITIRTARDAVTAAAQYLLWLGFAEVRVAREGSCTGVDLRGTRVVARVDPTTAPTALRDIETLWLNGLNDSVQAVCFCLAGYARDARERADELHIPLFVLDLTGTPQPVNDPADQLVRGSMPAP